MLYMSMAVAMHSFGCMTSARRNSRCQASFVVCSIAGFRRLRGWISILSPVLTLSRQGLVIGLCYPNPSPTAPTPRKHTLSLILALSLIKTHWPAHGGTGIGTIPANLV
jgi:hypothetical protein